MRRVVVLLIAVLMAAGCTSQPRQPQPESPLQPQWREVTPPLPPGTGGRVAVRDAAYCGGQWYVVGGVFGTATKPTAADMAQETTPAAWHSPDGDNWTSMRFAPTSYWGERNILSSVSCRDGKVAMVGAKSGGAHGNPRTSTWYERPAGVMTEVVASFELYGGPRAVNVGRLASGDTGWLIVGNRVSGASVWVSPDATEFTLIDHDPQLASDPTVDTASRDGVFADGRWTVVGSGSVPGRVPRVPMSWVSDDGKVWTRQAITPGPEFEDLQRVVPYQGALLSVGLRGEAFGTWRRPAGADWRSGPTFGSLDRDRRASPFVSGLGIAGDGLVATVSDGTTYGLWASPDGQRWRSVTTPARPTTAGEHIMTAVGQASSVLLLADDGQAGRAWLVDSMRYR